MTAQQEKALEIIQQAIKQVGAFDNQDVLDILRERVECNCQNELHDADAIIWVLAEKLAILEKAAQNEINTINEGIRAFYQLIKSR